MTDLVDSVLDDHRKVSRLLDDISASGDARNRRELVDRLIAELMPLWVASEQVMYPAAGVAAEHVDAESLMKEIQQEDPAGPRFEELTASVVAVVRERLRADEAVLTQLRTSRTPSELADLGRQFETAKKSAPTRPHPGISDKPGVNKVVGMVDRVRDTLSQRNT